MTFKKKLHVSCSIILFFSFLSADVFSAKLFLKDKNGVKHFYCESPGRVGNTKVTAVSKGGFRVIGPYYTGLVKTSSFLIAAQKGCGELRKINNNDLKDSNEKG